MPLEDAIGHLSLPSGHLKTVIVMLALSFFTTILQVFLFIIQIVLWLWHSDNINPSKLTEKKQKISSFSYFVLRTQTKWHACQKCQWFYLLYSWLGGTPVDFRCLEATVTMTIKIRIQLKNKLNRDDSFSSLDWAMVEALHTIHHQAVVLVVSVGYGIAFAFAFNWYGIWLMGDFVNFRVWRSKLWITNCWVKSEIYLFLSIWNLYWAKKKERFS